MDKFVVRGQAAADLTKQNAGSNAQRLRQTTIKHGSKVVVEEVIQHLKEELDDAKTENDMLLILTELENHFISLEMLEKTRIGVSVTRVVRRTHSYDVKQKALTLLKVWKQRAKKAMRRRARRVRTFGRNAAE